MIWDLKTRAKVHSLTVAHPKTKAALSFRFCRFVKPAAKDASSPSSSPPPAEVLVTCANSGSRGASALQVWSISSVSGSGSASGDSTFKLVANIALDQAPICALQLSHDHALLACASNRSNIFVFDTRTWRRTHAHPAAHDLPVTGLAFSPDAQQLLSVSADRSSKIFATRRPPMSCGALLKRAVLGSLAVLLLLVLLAALGYAPAVREVLVGVYITVRVAVYKLALACGFE